MDLGVILSTYRESTMNPRAWSMVEMLGISIPNPRAVPRWTLPPGLSKEALDRIERMIDQFNELLEIDEGWV
jgi:hypothetical protein